MISDPGWKIGDEGNGSIENPEPREDFVKRATEVSAKYGLTLPEIRQAA